MENGKKMLNNKSIYLPALNASIIGNKDILHKNGKSFRFYNDDSIFKYSKFLVSAGANFKRKNFISDLNINRNKTFILGDSGGYQLVTGKLKQSEELTSNVLNWLEENTNYAMNLDFPPQDKFQERMEISYQNFKYFYEHKKNKTKLMNVLHGPTLERLLIWYDRMKEFDFEGGWGMGSIRGGNIFYFLLNFFLLFEKGEIRKYSGKGALIHFLGFSRIRHMPILLYLQHKLNLMDIDIKITFDSSYPFITATYGNFYLSMSETGFKQMKIPLSIIKNKEDIFLDENMPCNCPVCRGVTLRDVLKNHVNDDNDKSIFYLYLGCHNFYKMMEYKSNIEKVIRFNNNSIYNNTFDTNLMEIFGIIDKAFQSKKSSKYIQEHRKTINIIDKNEKQETRINNFIL